MIPNGSLTNDKIRDEKALYEDILILSDKSDWSRKETPTALMSQAVISFVSKWGHQHKWILFGDRNSTNFLNSGLGFKIISVVTNCNSQWNQGFSEKILKSFNKSRK